MPLASIVKGFTNQSKVSGGSGPMRVLHSVTKSVQWFKFPPEDPENLYVYLTSAQMSLVGILVVVYLVIFLRL